MASAAVPPARKMFAPACVASGLAVLIIQFFAVVGFPALREFNATSGERVCAVNVFARIIVAQSVQRMERSIGNLSF
jgi:hypothetical protein